MKKVGERLLKFRLKASLTQKQLGYQLDVTFQQIQKYEKNLNRMSINTFFVFCQAVGIPPVDFFDEENFCNQLNKDEDKEILEFLYSYGKLKQKEKDAISTLIKMLSK